ncbi:MAG: hypothetical protein ACK5QH_04515 [Rubrivivax sp.]|jgi:hypothetical protein|uniref:hypothetical protein n=1 Tax=Inhella sp. TaxID=1921806 RepID=UPI0022C21805|nr:hypothetical protein [Inhella sp.]MCZ8233771.1 hypothetical protein [Inhella sp.]
MRRAFSLGWALAMLGLLLSYPLLPPMVGDPGKEAPRALYMGIMVFVLAQTWLCSHRFIAWIGHTSPDLLNLPHKAYWMHPDRRHDSVERMATHVSGLGLQVLTLMAGMHLYVLFQSQPSGPQVPIEVWLGCAALLGLAFAAWIWRALAMFPAPPKEPVAPTVPRRPRRPGETH